MMPDSPHGSLIVRRTHEEEVALARVEIIAAVHRLNAEAVAKLSHYLNHYTAGAAMVQGEIDRLERLAQRAAPEDFEAAVSAHAAAFLRMSETPILEFNGKARVLLVQTGMAFAPAMAKLQTLAHIYRAYPQSAQKRARAAQMERVNV